MSEYYFVEHNRKAYIYCGHFTPEAVKYKEGQKENPLIQLALALYVELWSPKMVPWPAT